MTSKNNWRYNFGVVRDDLRYLNNSIKERVAEVRHDAHDRGYKGIISTTESESIRWADNGWAVTGNNVRSSVVKHAKGFLVLSYSYKPVKSEVAQALYNGTPVWVFSPYKATDMVHPTSVDEWYILCNEEHSDNIEDAVYTAYLQNQKDIQNDLVYVLNQPCTWLGEQYTRLYKLLNEFSCFDEFMTYTAGVVDEIKDEGEWDTETSCTMVQNIKASVYQYVSTSGENKGLRCTGSNERFGVWENYEVLPADVLQEFLSLTFYKSVGIKPLARVMTDGEDMYLFKKDTELHTTPIYVEQN